MKKAIELFLFSLFLLCNCCNAQTNTPQPSPTNGAVQASTTIVVQPHVNSNSAAPLLPAIALPADIASLTAKEILSANNQVVGQIASMYQHFGLFITIIVTFVGIIATVMGYLAKKNVDEFIKEWKTKMESMESEMKASMAKLESEMNDSLRKLREAVDNAEGSVKKAAGHAQSIEDDKAIISKTLEDVGRLRSTVASILEQLNSQQPIASPAPSTVKQPALESKAGDEDAQITAQLKGKFNSGIEEGKTHE